MKKKETSNPKKDYKIINGLENQHIKSSFEKVNEKVQSSLNTFAETDKDTSNVLKCLKRGSNSFLRVDRTENTNLDTKWIKMIEDAIPSIDEIIKNPRINTKTVTNLVPVELAKKTGSESIQHLSTHSQFVKEIDKDGNVIPSKILNIENEDNYITYENKFIATLIRRLLLFVEKRFEYITKYSPLKDYQIMLIKNRCVINGVEYQIESKVVASKVSENTTGGKMSSAEFLKKVNLIRKYCKYFYSSPFMRMFKNEKNVRSPIIQTNIIRKNPKYRKCYELYRFIERYNKLGVNFVIKEDFKKVDESDYNDIYNLELVNVLALKGTDAKYPIKSKSKIKKPKIENTIDDDIFTFFPLGEDPEFIRIDDAYLNYRKNNTEGLKRKPQKPERQFAIGNYLKKGRVDRDEERRKELLKRKKEEEKNFLKEQKELAILEEKERIKAETEAQMAEEKAKLAELNKARAILKEKASEHLEENEKIFVQYEQDKFSESTFEAIKETANISTPLENENIILDALKDENENQNVDEEIVDSSEIKEEENTLDDVNLSKEESCGDALLLDDEFLNKIQKDINEEEKLHQIEIEDVDKNSLFKSYKYFANKLLGNDEAPLHENNNEESKEESFNSINEEENTTKNTTENTTNIEEEIVQDNEIEIKDESDEKKTKYL